MGELRVTFKYKMAIVGKASSAELPLAESAPSMFCLSPAPPRAKTFALLARGPCHDLSIRFKYMELARVYELSAVNHLHFQSFPI